MSLYADQMRCVLAIVEGMDAIDKLLDEIAIERDISTPVYVKGPLQIVDEHGDVYCTVSAPDGLGWQVDK